MTAKDLHTIVLDVVSLIALGLAVGALATVFLGIALGLALAGAVVFFVAIVGGSS